MIYCDSSFLISLYIGTEALSSAARQIADSFQEPIAFPWLSELEVLTTLYRSFRAAFLRSALDAFNSARQDGILVECVLEQEACWRRALELSKRHVARIKCRILDILHIALALEIAPPYFVSFDRRQRQLAEAVHLKILPEDLDPFLSFGAGLKR